MTARAPPTQSTQPTVESSESLMSVFVPISVFEYKGFNTNSKNSSLYKYLLGGCPVRYKKNGKKSFIVVTNNSTYNLRQHSIAYHATQIDAFNAARDLGPEGSRKRQAHGGIGKTDTMDQHVLSSSPRECVQDIIKNKGLVTMTQAQLDSYIVIEVRPFIAVKKPGFLGLFGQLAGNLKIKSPSFFVNLLDKEYHQKKTLLIESLQAAKYVSTTADCCTAHQRSFFCMTVHWIGEDLVLRSACLVVRRIRGSHTYLVIGHAMGNIISEFKISSITSETMTDNGNNFVESFVLFGRKTSNLESESDEEPDGGDNVSEDEFDEEM